MNPVSINTVFEVLPEPQISNGSLSIEITLQTIDFSAVRRFKMGNYESRGSGDASSSGRSGHQQHPSVFVHEHRRCHGGHGPFPRNDVIGLGSRNTEVIGGVGRREVVHLVVEDDAGSEAAHSTPEAEITPEPFNISGASVQCFTH